MRLPELAGITLPAAIALVTRNPAQAVGLMDRGEIAIGKRADLIAISNLGNLWQVERVWSNGKQTLSAHFDQR
jgi:alpha-D-ribose 1-methylphosphonate 5-triphosphate diphosphatase